MKKAIAALLSLCIFGGNVPSFGDPHTSADASDKNALYAHIMSQYATTETTSSLCDSEKSLEKLTVEAVAAQNTAVRAKAQETAAIFLSRSVVSLSRLIMVLQPKQLLLKRQLHSSFKR